MPSCFLRIAPECSGGLFLASWYVLLDLDFSQAAAQSTSFKIKPFITNSYDRLDFLLLGSANAAEVSNLGTSSLLSS